jgi:DNA-binding MarR family transcriptional regulator
MCDRPLAKRLITRRDSTDDGREVTLACTARGKNLVDQVTQRRRAEMAAVVQRVRRTQRAAVIEALNAFSDAANEPPEAAWAQGWGLK